MMLSIFQLGAGSSLTAGSKDAVEFSYSLDAAEADSSKQGSASPEVN